MSANIKASTDGTQAIIGVGGVDQMTVSNSGVVTANSFVGAISGNASSATALATGSTTARTLENRFADVVNVKDFGAVGDGVADDTAAIQAAINSCGIRGLIYFPKGTYKLDSNVTVTSGLISYIINTGVIFTGTGNINSPSAGYGVYYDGKVKDTNLSVSKSDDKTAATALFAKYSTKGNSGVSQNPALYGLGYKFSTENKARVQGVFGEGIDASGGTGSFVEGGRFHGICLNSSSGQNGVYGAITFAQSGAPAINTSTAFVIGCESEVISFNVDGDAPVPRSFNVGRFNANFLATNRDGNKVDASFIVNPYNNVSAKAGFVVAKGVGLQKTVDSVGFACYETGVVYGIDLAKGSYTYAAISIPNNTPVRAYNAAGTLENNIITLTNTNVLALGVDADVAHTQTKSILPTVNNTYQLGSLTPAVWSNIYSQNPVTVVSDERRKKDIEISILGLDFINKLNPVSYKFIEGGNNVVEWDEKGNPTKIEPISGLRTHFGLIAQEVKEAIPKGVDFGGWVLSDKDDIDSLQALRYEQFIAPIIKAIQELSDKVKVLENK